MNKKWIIIGLLICLLVAGLAFIFGSGEKENSPLKQIEPTPQSQTALTPAASVPPSHKVPPPNLPPVPPGVVVPPEVAKNPTALIYFLAEMTPISFYGKVVDEKNAPIEGASADIMVADKVFQDGSNYKKTTDSAGLFSITGVRGLFVGITVSKEGYYRLPQQSSGKFGYASGISSTGPRPTPDHPAIFILRKKGAGVKLIVKNISGHLSPNGTPVDVDLEAGNIASPNAGDLRMELWSNFNQGEPNKPYDWKYRISIPGGGLVERTDDLAFEAPNDGYQPVDEGSFTVGQDRYVRDLDKQYFVKLADDKYARITLSLSRGFNITAYINPTAENRNLEPASK